MIYLKKCGGMGSPGEEYTFMKKSVFVLAVIGAACSSVAFAAEVKKDKSSCASREGHDHE